MAGKKENIKALFSNTRTRVIILFTVILLVTTVVIGFFKLRTNQEDLRVSTSVKKVPTGIHSIPGSMNQTAQYATLQNKQNVDQAETAKKSGASAIPTIIKTQAFGEGVDLIGPQYGEGGPGFTTLSRSNLAGPEKSLWSQQLQNEHCSSASIKAVSDKGATLSDLREECNCCQLRQYGYTLPDLDPVCSCPELKAAGFSAREMKVAGYTVSQLKRCGFSACETRSAGFAAEDMKDGGFTDGELKGAGFSEEAIEAAKGLPSGVSLDDVRSTGCDPEKIARLREKGVTAAAIQRISGCNAAQLKASGFSPDALRRAGFSAATLKAAGFSPEELKKAGYGARDLMNAGLSPDDLTKAGFSAEQIERAQSALPPGVTMSQLRKAGCSVETLKRERAAGVSAGNARQAAGCSLAALKAAGFTETDLAHAGFSPSDIASTAPEEGVVLTEAQTQKVRAAGCDPEKLAALKAKGMTAKQVHDLNGCSAAQLKAAGFGVKGLADAGFSPAELLRAGFDSGALNNAGLIPAGVIAEGRKKGCSVEELKAARNLGVSATTIRETLGCSAKAMAAAGYSAQELKDAGSSAADLKAAGFSDQALKDAGYSGQELKDAGLSDDQLKTLGLSVEAPKQAESPDTEKKGTSSVEESTGPSSVTRIPPLESTKKDAAGKAAKSETKDLQELINRQQLHVADQKYQAKIKQLSGRMLSAANQALQGWKAVPTQVFILGSEDDKSEQEGLTDTLARSSKRSQRDAAEAGEEAEMQPKSTFIKTGDILFAVLDTAVNTDEPGPILATIVSGKLKGSKIIGSFTLPSNADKMVITFNTLSMLGADQTISISAYAIDPNTARTALASRVNHHYLMRYGSLFASTFLAGFSSAIQSADTTITIGGTGGTTDTTVQNGINRSLLENALIGLGEVGKAWSETAQELMNRPTTVELFSGTGMGILFTQDVQIA